MKNSTGHFKTSKLLNLRFSFRSPVPLRALNYPFRTQGARLARTKRDRRLLKTCFRWDFLLHNRLRVRFAAAIPQSFVPRGGKKKKKKKMVSKLKQWCPSKWKLATPHHATSWRAILCGPCSVNVTGSAFFVWSNLKTIIPSTRENHSRSYSAHRIWRQPLKGKHSTSKLHCMYTQVWRYLFPS